MHLMSTFMQIDLNKLAHTNPLKQKITLTVSSGEHKNHVLIFENSGKLLEFTAIFTLFFLFCRQQIIDDRAGN